MIYDRSVWQLMADAAGARSPPYTVEAIEGWFRDHFPKIKQGTVAAHIRGLTANDPSRHHHPGLAAKSPLFFRTVSDDLVRFDADRHTGEARLPVGARQTCQARHDSAFTRTPDPSIRWDPETIGHISQQSDTSRTE